MIADSILAEQTARRPSRRDKGGSAKGFSSMSSLPLVAARAINAPLAFHPDKLQAIITAIGPRNPKRRRRLWATLNRNRERRQERAT
jgi:hypothetical protein